MLAVIVLVRTVLSLSIDVEIDGRWPWQAAEQEALARAAQRATWARRRLGPDPVSAAIAEGEVTWSSQQAECVVGLRPSIRSITLSPSSIARLTTPNTPFAACDYDPAIARLGAGPPSIRRSCCVE